MTMNDEFAFRAIRHRIDDPENKAVVVVIVNADDTIDTVTAGIDNAVGLWSIFFSLAAQLSDEVMEHFTPEQRAAAPRVAFPTMEQARELGIVQRINRNGRRHN